MEKKLNNLQRINDFLDGNMVDDEIKAFDHALKNDQELAKDFAFVLASNQVLLQYSDQDMEDFEASARELWRQKLTRYAVWSTAAVAVLFLGLWLLFNRNYVLSSQERSNELVMTIKANESNLRTAGGSTWKQDLLQQQYFNALKKIDAELNNFPNEDCPAEDLQYWKGLLLLCVKDDAAKAIPPFQCALQKGYQKESSVHFLIIAFLENGQTKTAKDLAQRFPEIALKLSKEARKRLE